MDFLSLSPPWHGIVDNTGIPNFFIYNRYTHIFREASSMKLTKYLLPPNESTSMGPQTLEYTNSNFSNFQLNFFWNETL